MDGVTAWLSQLSAYTNHPLGLVALCGAAFVEYVFPPFPGDAMVLLGGALVGNAGWNLILVGTTVFAGSWGGSLFAYCLGRHITKRRAASHAQKQLGPCEDSPLMRDVKLRLRTGGHWYLVFARFLPGARAVVYTAAGLVGMPPRVVVLWSLLSAILWVTLFMTIGVVFANQIVAVIEWVGRLGAWLLAVVLAIVLVAIAGSLVKRRMLDRKS